MNLKQWQDKFGVKRIDFSKIKCKGLKTQYESDKMICPYCGTINEFESGDSKEVINGTVWRCCECERNFYVSGDVTINTYARPLEDTIAKTWIGRYIQSMYDHVDKCEKNGMDFPDRRYGFVEWEIYYNYAKPLFENMERDENERTD